MKSSRSNDSTTTAKGATVPAWIERRLAETFRRVNNAAAAGTLWERKFTDDDREELGGDLDAAFGRHGGAIGMWMDITDCGREQAVVELGVELDLLTESEAHDLRMGLRQAGVKFRRTGKPARRNRTKRFARREFPTLNQTARDAARTILDKGPLTGDQIALEVHRTPGHFHRDVIPVLKEYGLVNDRDHRGYYFPEDAAIRSIKL